jgi:hypothetical protein
MYPALEDRREAVQKGIAELGPTEQPIYDFVKMTYPAICTHRELYMQIFYAMAHYSIGDYKQANEIFYQAYVWSRQNDIIMPFAECGKHVTLLLDGIEQRGDVDQVWIKKVRSLANQYEVHLAKFRKDYIHI